MSYTFIDTEENIIDIFENDIDKYITLFCEKENIENLKKESQNIFSAVLYYLYLHVFSKFDFYKDNNKACLDYKKLYAVLNSYIMLCDKYDKIITANGFSRLVGIDETTLYVSTYRDGASAESIKLLKKLNAERERTLAERLASGKVNPVGVLGCLNHWHGWSGVGNMTEDREKQVASLETIRGMVPELTDNSSETGTE